MEHPVVSHPARAATLRSGVALAGWGLLAVLVATAIMMLVAAQQLRALAETEAQARAQRIADALALRVQRAVSVGIPLDMLEGVDALFEQRMQSSRDIDAIALAGVDDRLLWLRATGGGSTLPQGPRVVAEAQHQGQPVARVLVVWQPPQVTQILARWALPLLGWALAVAVLAAMALRWSWMRGLCRRDAQVAAAAQRVLAGDYDWRLPADRRRDFDPRTGWLSAEIRHANELHLRIRRLVHSLRHTEPDAGRRAELEAALDRATAADRFRGEAPPQVIDVRTLPAIRHWRGVCWGTSAWLLVGVGLWAVDVAPVTPLLVAAAVAAIAWGAVLLMELRSAHRRSVLNGAAIGLLLTGPSLVVPWVLALGGSSQTAMAPVVLSMAVVAVLANLGWCVMAALRDYRVARQLLPTDALMGGDRAA